MRPKTPPFKPLETKEERESTIKGFILAALGDTVSRHDAIQLLARSPSSPVVQALLALSDELGARDAGAAIVLAGGPAAAHNETWSLSFSGRFIHEIRLTSNPRVLDGHEQLIVGDSAVWYGDCMRRDPLKRDAFATFLHDDPAAARSARFAFRCLWMGARSIYRNVALSSVVVTASGEEVRDMSALPGHDDMAKAAATGSSVAENLAAWQPATRH